MTEHKNKNIYYMGRIITLRIYQKQDITFHEDRDQSSKKSSVFQLKAMNKISNP